MKPTLVVQVADVDDTAKRPAGIEALDDRLRTVYTDAVGLADAIEDADALLVWDYFSPALRQAWPRARRLAWVHVAAAGVDRLLFDELVASEVVITNAKGVFDRPIAEYVLACVLAHAKGLRDSYRLQETRQWQHRETRSIEGTTAMVVGTGGIGLAIGHLLAAVGMRVYGAARAARPGDGTFVEFYASSRLAEHVRGIDYLIVATPLTPATRGLVNADVLAALPPRAYVINIARGACLDEQALAQQLADGALAGAALDVFTTEPLPADHPFWSSDKVLVSPHMSGDVRGWRSVLAGQFVDNARRWLDGRALRNTIDKPAGFAAPGS